ncbi:invasion associated locus B family protein [Ancylobacter sp. TS-1]|uniref:invasion associated locus B family protein n=1 Tax=Ancylobacter sp. TS-1 TaxID=1850374 RepID=UPI001265D0B9|nr:invasion associated locus B family protein [Ancylobacter sp. TS-1]QFR34403.1 invasion associated locus B family protein [Ancylobacter sp. TS-1]
MTHRFLMLAGFLAGLGLAGTAWAQQPAAPAPAAAPARPGLTTATYQDWVVRCVAADKGRICEVVQNIQAQGQGVIASVAVGRADAKAPLRLVVQLPAGVWLPAGVKVQLREKAKPLQLVFTRCPQGCLAEVELDATSVQALRTATEAGNFSFEDGARRPVTLPLSFRGFTAALDASLKP